MSYFEMFGVSETDGELQMLRILNENGQEIYPVTARAPSEEKR